ncbi:MAG: helix-turn-helix domain-containing protein [Hydrogenophaga sp.]|nr:helix-turn-helix domain-containing protein [Hydrogenophaga sp.]
MPLFAPVFPQRYFAPMLKVLEQAPRDLQRAFAAAAGLPEGAQLEPDFPISLERLEDMLTLILATPGYADFALEVGLRLRVSDHGPLAPLLLRCRTLEERMRMQARYHRLISPSLSLQYMRYADRGELLVRPVAPMGPTGLRVMLELYAFAGYVNLPADALNSMEPFHIYLSMQPPSYVARLQALKGVRFHFVRTGLPEMRLVVPGPRLLAPLAPASSARDEAEAEQLADRVRSVSRTTRVSDWVRLLLREAEAHQPTADELAELINVGRKTFERALAAEGESYRDLAKAVRHQRACEYLDKPGVSVGHIAYRLGYSDIASFSHAFRAMAGCSPSQYRRQR